MPVVKGDRKLVTIEQISSIRPIEGADAIVQGNVRAWPVVVKKGEYSEGDLVLYFEPDTALPLEDERFGFLRPRGYKNIDGEDFHVLKTARLRGAYSQGLVLPVESFMNELSASNVNIEAGVDVTTVLGLGKWEAPIPVGNGETAGAFTSKFARKTDSERVQNLVDVYSELVKHDWDVTEKVDGTSCTVARDDEGNLRVNGRNWEIREGDNTYWNVVRKFSSIFDVLEPGDAVQFEICGPGIQGNRLKLNDVRPFIFDVVRKGEMVSREDWAPVHVKWSVPVITGFSFPETAGELIEQVDGMKSVINSQVLAEGIVFHTSDGSIVPEVGMRNTFKVVSNKFLLKHGD